MQEYLTYSYNYYSLCNIYFNGGQNVKIYTSPDSSLFRRLSTRILNKI